MRIYLGDEAGFREMNRNYDESLFFATGEEAPDIDEEIEDDLGDDFEEIWL